MSPATWPRDDALGERLLHVDPKLGTIEDATVGDLPSWIRAGDLVVINDAATLPASLQGVARGEPVEIRLAGEEAPGAYLAVLFGKGDWRTKTEDRPAPPALVEGDRIELPGLSALVVAVSPASARLVRIRFDRSGARLFEAIYRVGKPIQYSYLERDLELWHIQTRYSSRPWAMELPSAGRPLTFGLLAEIRARGARVATLTHAAGLSSTGDATLDAMLPLPERFDIPEATAIAIRETKARGGRVIAVGTTVARALEGCAAQHDGEIVAGTGVTDLLLGRSHTPRVVDGLFTGMHDPTASHFHLMEAFAPPELLERAHAHAGETGYLCHEFGDSTLLLSA